MTRRQTGAGKVRRALTLAWLVASIATPAGAAARVDGPHGLRYACRLAAVKLGGEITLAFRLRTDGSGDEWRVRLFHDDELVFSKRRVTNAEGNLKVVRVEPNLPGIDVFDARARHLDTGAVCEVETRI
jgi:hypothetical protein